MVDPVVDIIAGLAVADRLPTTFATSVQVLATRNLPGSARICMSFGNSRLISAFSFFASVRMDRIPGWYLTGTPRRYRGSGSSCRYGLHFMDDICRQCRACTYSRSWCTGSPHGSSPSTSRPISNAETIRSTASPGVPRTSRRARPSSPCSGHGASGQAGVRCMLLDLFELKMLSNVTRGLYWSRLRGSRSA